MKPFKQTLLIILLILLLPTLIFSIYELGSLRKNEAVIDEIYANQLNAILYSINQYSEDVISSWAQKFENCYNPGNENTDSCIQQTFTEISSGLAVMEYLPFERKLKTIQKHDFAEVNELELQLLLADNDTTLKKLITYLRANYRKVESFSVPGGAQQLFVFAMQQPNQEVRFFLLLQDPEQFIRIVLDPKIQEIAQEKFSIIAINSLTDSVIYSSDRLPHASAEKHTRPFWLMPNYAMGIELQNITIDELSRNRSIRNLILIGIIDLVLLLGVALIYRNVKNQMELSQLKSDFVSNVSHEIRTPLALISMYIETLEMGRVKTQEKMQEYYRVIQQETRRLTGIVNKILNFSQIEGGKKEYSFAPTNLNALVEDVYKSYQIRLDREEFTHALELSKENTDFVADHEAITDVVINLVDNAMKYSGDKKDITLKTSAGKNSVILSVRDKGIGIADADQKYIFDKFYRVTEKNLALKAKGSGLGLAIVKHILDAHHATISIKSKWGEGSEFILEFPKNKTKQS